MIVSFGKLSNIAEARVPVLSVISAYLSRTEERRRVLVIERRRVLGIDFTVLVSMLFLRAGSVDSDTCIGVGRFGVR